MIIPDYQVGQNVHLKPFQSGAKGRLHARPIPIVKIYDESTRWNHPGFIEIPQCCESSLLTEEVLAQLTLLVA